MQIISGMIKTICFITRLNNPSKSMNRHVHQTKLRIVLHFFLTIKSHCAICIHTRLIDKISRLNKHSTGTTGWIKENTTKRLNNIYEILKGRPSRGGRVLPVEASDFIAKSALFLPKEAQYDYLLNLPEDISVMELINKDGHTMTSLGEVVNNAMLLIEDQSEQLTGVLPKSYTNFSDEILSELLRPREGRPFKISVSTILNLLYA